MAKKKQQKTNAARILDRLGIDYELKEYEVDESDLSAVHVAASVGMPIERVYKTLVARGDKNGIVMAVIQGDLELDLKALAAASGNKRVEMVHLKEVFALTGYIRGGCSPLGAKKDYPVYLDERAQAQETIAISAGKRGEQIILKPDDLVSATAATVAQIAR
jgi:Cys-tRNA(Pro)/Cys-tRNA(Cys) deacylase